MRLFVLYLFLGLIWVCEIEISHMGKNNGNPVLVRENFFYLYLTESPKASTVHSWMVMCGVGGGVHILSLIEDFT